MIKSTKRKYMQFSLAYTKNAEQIIIQSFNHNENPSMGKIMNYDELKNQSIQGLIYDPSVVGEDFIHLAALELKYFPVRSSVDFQLSLENFEKLTTENAQTIFQKMNENWILQNNLSLIEDIFKTKNHLLSLFPNDRSGFFEELWFLLKSNFGAMSLTIFYNDLVKAKNENEKNKLIKVKLVGNRFPEPLSLDEIDEKIFKSYEKQFGQLFEISDYNKEKGEVVICATIKKSPVLMMAKIYQLTRIQKAILSSLFEGINS